MHSNDVSDDETDKIVIDEDRSAQPSPAATPDSNVSANKETVAKSNSVVAPTTTATTQNTTSAALPPQTPNLDEITIIPINNHNRDKSKDDSDAPPAKMPRLDSGTAAVSIIKRPSIS